MFYVYIVTNKIQGTLFIGLTANIIKRSCEHKMGVVDGFAKRYHLNVVVLVETFDNFKDAFERKKRLKNWRREWKINLIESTNPAWEDLYPLSLSVVHSRAS